MEDGLVVRYDPLLPAGLNDLSVQNRKLGYLSPSHAALTGRWLLQITKGGEND
jgi:hypothetical protein